MAIKRLILFPTVLVSAGLLTGCVPIVKLEPGAESVVVSKKLPPKNCKKITKVTAKQSGKGVPANKLEQGAMNLARNLAYRKNANYLHIDENYSNFFQPGYGLDSVSSVVVDADAYYCPPKK